MAHYVALLHQLYLHGGPDHTTQARALDMELTQLAQGNPVQMPLLSADLAMLEAVRALQQGELRCMASSIERGAAHCRNQHHAEPLWLAERMRAMSQINAGDYALGIPALEALHERAHQQRYFGTAPFCAFDRVLVFGDVPTTPKERLALCDALDFAASDPPSVWSLKLRALAAAGLRQEAESALMALPDPAEIARLPCDNDLLGTLGHLAHAVAWLGERRYAAAVYDRLAPYARSFSVQISFYCEGAVPQVLGVLARALGRESEAIAHFDQALVMNMWAGLAPQVVETRIQLASCLIVRDQAGDAARARQLRLEVEESPLRHGRQRIAQRISEFLRLNDEGSDAAVTRRLRVGRSLEGP
jgi:tetratricopeptide (TPR) repeat protein